MVFNKNFIFLISSWFFHVIHSLKDIVFMIDRSNSDYKTPEFICILFFSCRDIVFIIDRSNSASKTPEWIFILFFSLKDIVMIIDHSYSAT